MSTRRHEVVVVGGGPVGAAAAIALAQRGFEVALAERGAAPPAYDAADYDLRVYALAPHSARFLHALGAWEQILQRRASPYAAMRVWERDPVRVLRFAASDAGRADLGWIIEHALLVDSLWRQLGPVTRYEQAAIEAAEFGDDGILLRLADGRRLAARMVVAADGADSRLRSLAGIDAEGWNYGQRGIVCHVRTEKPHQATAWQRFLASGPLAFLPLADGRCSIVWSAGETLAQELLGLDDAAFCQRLGAASEHALGEVTAATRRLAFPLRLLHAKEYVRSGLALLGDAAHVVHPLAGQGVNLGFGDAEALAATLAASRTAGRDWSSLRNLQRYARARRAENVEMLALTDGLCRAFGLRAPGVRAALGLGMEAVDRLTPLKGWLAKQATL